MYGSGLTGDGVEDAMNWLVRAMVCLMLSLAMELMYSGACRTRVTELWS